MQYRCVAASPTGFVQQVAVHYLAHGYWFFVQGCVPPDKDPTLVDAKLIAKYGIGVSRQSRSRRKAVGIANIHYIRYGSEFLLLATHGHHPFYDEEGDNIRDARRAPILFAGYSLSVQKGGFVRKVDPNTLPERDNRWRARVQIQRSEYLLLKSYFLDHAIRWSRAAIADALFHVPYEPYAPVRQQMLNILRLINDKRRSAGLQPISSEALRYRRRIVKPFDRPNDWTAS
ncbi:MAG: hypothetical protein AB7G28_01185 [Pirellulales bacterium]